jgi:hypothetical protein
MKDRPGRFTLPRLLLCEGNEDKAFFERLIEVRKLPRFHIQTTADSRSEPGGNSRFAGKLRSLRFANLNVIKRILLVTDADHDRDERFEWLCKQIVDAGFGPAPARPLEESAGDPNISIMLIPLDEPSGCLECICQAAARQADVRTGQYVDTFVSQAAKPDWSDIHKNKVWLRTNLAARARDPFVFFGSVFRDPKNHNIIPLDHKSFQPIADVLSALEPSPLDLTTVAKKARTVRGHGATKQSIDTTNRESRGPKMRHPRGPAR